MIIVSDTSPVFILGNDSEKADILVMPTVTLTEAQKHLAELVHDLPREGEMVITDNDKPVAILSPPIGRTSLRDLQPASVGAVLRAFPSADDDTLGEMLD